MSRPIEKALIEIIPRLSGPLPPELTDLASSLLAQSRSKISNLKAEEEIGRTYACANLACERYLSHLDYCPSSPTERAVLITSWDRLKTSLNLPKIEPRPPCPPRVYAKLYAYFARELTSTGRKRGRPRAAVEPARPLPERHVPGREKGLEGFRTRAPRTGLKFGGNNKDDRLPRWVGPAIRALCAGLDAGRAVQHVIAGVESILFLPCPGVEDGDGDGVMGGDAEEVRMEGKIPALIVAIMSFAIVRLTGEETDAKEYNQRVKKSLALLRDLREDEAVAAKVGEDEESWEGWESITKKDVDGWLKEISSQGWLRMDWWENIDDGSGASGHIEPVDDDDIDADRKAMEEERARLWRTRSGTMKQDDVDYLSETKRKQYARWKELMLVRIDELEGGLAVDMDMQ